MHVLGIFSASLPQDAHPRTHPALVLIIAKLWGQELKLLAIAQDTHTLNT